MLKVSRRGSRTFIVNCQRVLVPHVGHWMNVMSQQVSLKASSSIPITKNEFENTEKKKYSSGNNTNHHVTFTVLVIILIYQKRTSSLPSDSWLKNFWQT